jgi:alpha-glucosidase (family GH31 glycosyl hydrolase)
LADPFKEMAKDSLYDRYQYLRHMYTCIYEVHNWGGSCFDPLFYFYPEDDYLFANPEESFMVGGALKVSPILAPLVNITGTGVNATTYTSYFPKGNWLSLRNFTVLNQSVGGNVTLDAGNTIQVHMREGTIIPF